MIDITEAAQQHFRRLIEREAIPGLGVKLAAVDAGTARADVRLEFAESHELQGDEWAIDCDGFTLWLDAASAPFLDGARIDYESRATGGQLQIRAPRIKGQAPAESASLVERVRWVVEHEINPQLAQHRGHVSVQEVTADGAVVLIANDKWWGTKPLAQRVTVWPRGADIQDRVNRGTFDVVDISTGSSGTLNLPSGYSRSDTPSAGIEQLIFSAQGPMAAPPNRRALALCTPRDTIARNAGVPIANARLSPAADDALAAAESADADVVDPYFDPAEALDASVLKTLDVFRLTDIGRDRQSMAAA